MFDSLANSESNNKDGSSVSYHVGLVVFNEDPDRQQRIKVTVPGFLEDPNPDNLPWVGPISHSAFGNTREFGSVRVPVLGSLVIVEFQNGDMNHGLYDGFVSTRDLGAAMHPDLATNYPHRYGFWDPKGNVSFTDLLTGESQFRHNSGTTINIAPNGRVTGTFVENIVATVSGNVDAVVNGHVTASIGGNLTAGISGNASVSVSGSMNLQVSGALTSSAPSWSHTGPLAVSGGITATGAISSDSEVSAPTVLSTTGNIVLETHVHRAQGSTAITTPPLV